MQPLLLGLDIGSSSVKASLVDARTGNTIVVAKSPSEEIAIEARQPGWAEQNPELWWEHTIKCVKACLMNSVVDPAAIAAIGIAYQMHGLVAVDKKGKLVRHSIIWCDSRAVQTGEKAFHDLGTDFCLTHFLNSPGNFTASKLKWVKENEPAVYEKIDKVMLPGDYIAYRLTGEIATTDTGLSEGIFWDYKSNSVSQLLLDHYGIDRSLLAPVKPVFSVQGEVSQEAAILLGIKKGTKVSYRAGDQSNNAFSLNVLKPGETAATAGTSGVIYNVTDRNAFDVRSRVNTFIHVNHQPHAKRNGVLLCINGTGILNSWLRKNIKSAGGVVYEYQQMNELARQCAIGAEGVSILPFGNGAERILENKLMASSIHGLDFNRHGQPHLFRAAQEGIVFALKYGFEILQSMELKTQVIRAGHANMFLSPLFCEAFVNTIGAPLELYNTDGAKGAALGAGIGAGIYTSPEEAFRGLHLTRSEYPKAQLKEQYEIAYQHWKKILNNNLES
jgi:xylulokinase